MDERWGKQVGAAQIKMKQESQMEMRMDERWGKQVGAKTRQVAEKKKVDNKEPIYEVDGLEMIGSTRVRPSPSKYPSIVIDDDDEPNEKSASLSQLKIEESVDISDVSSKKLRSDVITESIVIA